MSNLKEFYIGVGEAVKKQADAYQPEGMIDRFMHWAAPKKMEAMQQASNTYNNNVKPFVDEQGHIDPSKIMGGIGNWAKTNIINPLGQEANNVTSGNWAQAGDWVGQHPYLAGGTALAGGLLGYGLYRGAHNLFGGNEPRPQFAQPQPYAVPGAPQALEKYSGFIPPASKLSLNFAQQAIQQPNVPDQSRTIHEYNFHGGNTQARQLLADPRMREYLNHLVRGVEQNNTNEA